MLKKHDINHKEIIVANFLASLEIHNDDDSDNLIEYAEHLTDLFEGGQVEVEPLLDYVTSLIVKYDDEHHPVEKSAPLAMLKFYMDQNNHRQKDLIDIAPKSAISEILSGKRPMSKNVIRKLAEKYHTDPSVFF